MRRYDYVGAMKLFRAALKGARMQLGEYHPTTRKYEGMRRSVKKDTEYVRYQVLLTPRASPFY